MSEPCPSDLLIAYEEGLSRFAGSERLYGKHLSKFVAMDGFDELQKAMDEQRYDDAFRCAHSLTGNVGNLSLTRLYRVLREMTEALRNESDIDRARNLMPDVAATHRQTVEAVRPIVSNGPQG